MNSFHKFCNFIQTLHKIGKKLIKYLLLFAKIQKWQKGNVCFVLVRTTHLADWSQTYKKIYLTVIPWQNKLKSLSLVIFSSYSNIYQQS
jgi:hypothetical protein